MDTYDESQYVSTIPFAEDLIWQGMAATEQLDLILSTVSQEAWFDEIYLQVLASFRHDPVRWGRIKAQYKHIGGSPYDLERAADALNPVLQRVVTLASVDPGHTLTAVAQTMPQIARKLARQIAWSDEEHAEADILAMALFLETGWTEEEVIQLVRTLHGEVDHPSPSAAEIEMRLSLAYARIQGIHEVHDPDESRALAARAKSRALANLAGFFRVPCVRVIRHGIENALWHLRLADGRDIRLGTSEDLDNQKKVRTAIFDATGIRMTRLSAREAQKWDDILEMMHRIAEVIDTPELTRRGKIIGMLRGYLELKNLEPDRPMTHEEVESYLRDNRPCIQGDVLVFPLTSFYLDFAKAYEGSLSQATIMDMLKEIGGTQKDITLREGTARYHRRVWLIPLASIFDQNQEYDTSLLS